MLADLEAGQQELKEILAVMLANAKKTHIEAEKARLVRLIVQPRAPSKSSPSRKTARDAEETARIQLKIKTLNYYGLIVKRDGEVKDWRAHTMLDAEGTPALPLEACTLAHLWPSELGKEASQIAEELHLPEGFYMDPRNFLILPRDLHEGFDNLALIFLPNRDGNIMVRKWQLEHRSLEEQEALGKYFDRQLMWPEKASVTPHLPFMRLVAFRMMCAKHKKPMDDPQLFAAALNASVSSRGNEGVSELSARLGLM